MLWFGKKKSKAVDKPKSREALQAEALENARKAREAIGAENLDRLAAALHGRQQKPQSEGQAAQDRIRQMDKARIADNIKAMLDDK